MWLLRDVDFILLLFMGDVINFIVFNCYKDGREGFYSRLFYFKRVNNFEVKGEY